MNAMEMLLKQLVQMQADLTRNIEELRNQDKEAKQLKEVAVMIGNLEKKIGERKSPRQAPVDLKPVHDRIDGLEKRIDARSAAHDKQLTSMTAKHLEQYNELKKGIELTHEGKKHRDEADKLRSELAAIHEKLAKVEAQGPKEEPQVFTATESDK